MASYSVPINWSGSHSTGGTLSAGDHDKYFSYYISNINNDINAKLPSNRILTSAVLYIDFKIVNQFTGGWKARIGYGPNGDLTTHLETKETSSKTKEWSGTLTGNLSAIIQSNNANLNTGSSYGACVSVNLWSKDSPPSWGEKTYTIGNARLAVTYQTVWTVSFNGNGGTPSASSKTVYNENSYGTLPTISKPGYKFNGWYTAVSGGTKITETTVVNLSANQTLHAQWTPLTYIMSFNGNGSTSGSMGNMSMTEGNQYTLTPNAFLRTGYTFKEWNSKSDGTGVPMADKQVVRGVNETNPNPSFTKGRTPVISGAMEYSASGSPANISSEYISYGHPSTRDCHLCNLTAGHTYIVSGWGVADSSAQSTSTVGVHYNASGHNWIGSGNIAPSQRGWQRVENYFTIPSNSTEQHLWLQIDGASGNAAQLAGWYWTGVSCRDMSLSNSQTIYAQWTANTYTVVYNGNGATSGSTSNSTHTYNTSSKLSNNSFNRVYKVTYNYNDNKSAETKVDVSYKYLGWGRSSNATAEFSSGQSITTQIVPSKNGDSITLHAIWEETQTTLPTPTRTGYTFNGWWTAASGGTKIGNGGALYTPTADITLYAQWIEHKYNIRFDGNGADSGNMTQMNDIPYDTSKKLNLNEFNRIGYTFLGWSDAATHTQASYGDGAEISHLTEVDGNTITLYAIWKQNIYTITWKNSTGDGSSYAVSIKGGTRPNNLNAPNATKAYEEKVDGYHYLSYHWEPEFEIVGRDITYTAVFDATKHNYFDPVTTEPQGDYMGYDTHQCKQCNWSYKDEYAWLITFKNGDYNENRQDEVIKVPPGQVPQWSQIPEKTSENTLVFSFDTDNPWAPPVVATPTVEPSDKGNVSYTPQFKSDTRYYTITFENADGSIKETQILEYDQDIVPPEPLDIDNAQYDYTFEYWYAEDNKNDIILYGEKGKVKRDNVIYIPYYSSVVKAYRLEWWNNEGEEPILLHYQDNVPYGTIPEYPFNILGIPQKESTHDETFTFIGWDCVLVDPITGEESDFFYDDDDPTKEEDLDPVRWPTKYIAHFRSDTRFYKIKWLNPSEDPNKEWDTFYEDEIQYGDVPEFDITKSEILKELKHPQQGKDKTFNYIFIGWKTSINDEPIEGELPFQGEITYVAVYIKKYIEYSIKIYRFYGDDYLRDKENNPKPEEYIRHYGDKLYPNALLNDIIGHDFSHWSNNQEGTNELTKSEILSIVVEDTAEYWAIYTKKEYQVRWLDYNRVQIGDYKIFKYKDNPLNPEPPEQKPQEPTRGYNDLYHYTFRTWSVWSGRTTSDGRILGDVSYIANYDKHEHPWEETTYEFTKNGKECTASRICKFEHNGHIEEHSQNRTIKTTPTILEGDDATCTEKGFTTYIANFRDDWNRSEPLKTYRIQDIEPKGHDYAPADSLGKNIYSYVLKNEKGEFEEHYTGHYIYCKRCHYSYIEPHNWQPIEDTEITSYAACLIGGKRKYRCQTFGCEGYYYEYIEPNGHNFTEDRQVKEVESTCTKPGNRAYKQCSDCLLFFSENANIMAYGEKTNKSFLTAPKGHDYKLVSVEKANCVNEGKEYKSCTRLCGEEGADIEIIIPPRGHDWVWQSTITPATCTQEGKEKYYCQNTRSDKVTELYKQCEEEPKEAIVPKTPHQPVTTYGYKPTCTKDGLSDGTKCRICNTELTLQYTLPALGHKYVAKNVVPAENTLRREIIYGCIRKDCKHNYHIEYIK